MMSVDVIDESILELGFYPAFCHEHLGGSDSLRELGEIAVDRGIRGVTDVDKFVKEAIRRRGASENLDSYLRIFHLVEAIQSGRHAISKAVRRVVENLFGALPDIKGIKDQSRIIEFRLNPFKRTGILRENETLYDADSVMRAIDDEVTAIERDYDGSVRIGVVLCFARDFAPELNEKLSDKIIRWQEIYPSICGVDLAGPESAQNFSDSKIRDHFARCYNFAANGKLGKTIHLGETDYTDPYNFSQMIEALSPQRVAHPISAIFEFWQYGKRPCLEMMRERNIVAELCPNSNFLTNRISDWKEFARVLQSLDEFEIPYLFGTDNPALEGISWQDIIAEGLERGGISKDQLKRAIATSRKATFIEN